MSYLYNITFVCSEADAPAALDFLRSSAIPALAAGAASEPRLRRVHTNANEAISFALELRLPDFRSIRPWREQTMRPALEAMAATWGDRLMYFDTLLEELPL